MWANDCVRTAKQIVKSMVLQWYTLLNQREPLPVVVAKQRVLHMLLPPTTIFTTFSTFVYTRPDISTHIEKKIRAVAAVF